MFQPRSIPFVGGARQDLAALQTEDPSAFQVMENAIFLKRGSVRGRPSTVSEDHTVQTAGGGTAIAANLGAAGVPLTQPAGIVPVQVPSTSGLTTEAPMILYQGWSAVLTEAAGPWRKVGTPVFLRTTRSPALTTTRVTGANRANPVPCGTNVTGVVTTQGPSTGIPYLNDQAQVKYLGTGTLANLDAAGKANIAAAGNALFHTTTIGDVLCYFPSSLPTTTITTIGNTANTSATPRQNIAAVVGESGAYYVAYVSSVAGRITVKRVNPLTGATTASLDLNGLGTVLGVALAADSSNPSRLVLAWIDTVGPTLKTKVLTGGGAIADAALDVNFATAPSTSATFFGLSCGLTAAGTASVSYVTSTGSCFIGGRSFTAATQTSNFTLHGRFLAFGGIYWEPLFGAQVVQGRTYIGIARSADFSRISYAEAILHRSQWIVLDVTELYASSNTTARRVVAFGQMSGCDRIPVSSATVVNGTTIAFAVHEGVTFSPLEGVTQSRAVRVHLSLAPAAGAHAQGITYLSTNGHQAFDGAQLRTQTFVETSPYIQQDSGSGAGGALAAGSYSLQVTWEAVNARGQVIRSAASEVFTATAVLNDKITIKVSVPQLWEYTTDANRVRVRLWATTTTPSAGAPLYYSTETLLTAIPGSAEVTLEHTTGVSTQAEQLYTVGNILDDEPMPAGDRGVALAGERVWVADQRRVFASKLLRPNVAPAWNTEGLHTIEIPSALGEVQGLAGYEDRLVVVCSDGCAMVRGPGYDDQGNGPGWAVDTLKAPGAGVITPRKVTGTPDGAVYQGRGGALWLITPDGAASRFTGPLSNEVIDGDVTYAPAVPIALANGSTVEGTRRLFHGGFNDERVRHFDLDMGAWSVWTYSADTTLFHHCSINGVLWAQHGSEVVSHTGTSGDDTTLESVVLKFRTATIPVASTPGGWGRLRKLRVIGEPPNGTVTVTAYVLTDNTATVVNEAVPWSGLPDVVLWPHTNQPEFTVSVQRCSYFWVELSFSAGTLVELSSLEFWSWGGEHTAPSANRS